MFPLNHAYTETKERKNGRSTGRNPMEGTDPVLLLFTSYL